MGKYNKALAFWTVGIQYLHVVEAIGKECISQGNNITVVSDRELTDGEISEQTIWSDHNLVIPLLFDFYHGVEVILKGFLVYGDKLSGKKNHKIKNLLNRFETKFPRHKITQLLAPYIDDEKLLEPIKTFCGDSSVSVDEFYQALKYPESFDGEKIYIHTHLKYRGEEGLEFFSRLVEDIIQLRLEVVKLGRSLEGKSSLVPMGN